MLGRAAFVVVAVVVEQAGAEAVVRVEVASVAVAEVKELAAVVVAVAVGLGDTASEGGGVNVSPAGWKGVGVALAFEAEAHPLLIHLTVLALETAVQEVARVELHAVIIREHLHNTPALRFHDTRSRPQSTSFSIDDVVVVVPLAEAQ